MKKILTIIAAASLLGAGTALAQPRMAPEAAKWLREDNTRAGNNTNSYEFHTIKETPAPKGYKPFYVSHFSRHGSRSNWGGSSYELVIEKLTEAKAQGILTVGGDSLLSEAKRVLAAYDGMDGRLAPRGVREHAQIAANLYNRYPKLFKGENRIRAISSTVQRCILSMCGFTNELCRQNPKLEISVTAGEKIDEWLNNTGKHEFYPEADKLTSAYRRSLPQTDTTYVMQRLFTDQVKAHKIVGNVSRFQGAIFSTASIAEDFDIEENLYRFLPFDVIYNSWSTGNRELYIKHCNSVEFGAERVVEARGLVADIVKRADEAIAGAGYVADLRFGHDHPMLGLVSYLGIEGVGDRLSFNEIDDHWLGFFNIPMASNLQLVFYRNKSGDVLVKFFYNEKEVKLRGLEPVTGPYYRWETVKANLEGWKRP